MRVKFTIAVCALLMLGLVASQAYAQSGGYAVSRSIETVVQHGKNQMVGQIQLDYDANGGDIDAGGTITITFGGLPVTGAGNAVCTNGITCNAGATVENDEDTGAGTVTIETTGTLEDNSSINLMGTRVDVSSLDAEDEIVATISTTAPSGLIPIGQSRRGSVAAVVAEVMPGLTVGISAASRLICNLDALDGDMNPVGGIPMITVTEGFNDAWEDNTNVDGISSTVITIATLNLPGGVTLRFPASVTFTDPDDDQTTWATLTLSGDSATEAVVDEMVEDNENDGSMVTYDYTIQNASESMGAMDSFEIPITVVTGDIASGAGGIADIWGILGPQPADDDADVGTVLSYLKDAVTDPMTDMGDFLNIGECVTYLLFPYVTCSRVDEAGALMDDWTTAIAIANTTLDDGVFGISEGATAQSGSIVLHTFPRSKMNDDGMRMMAGPDAHEVASSVAAGDTWSDTCSNFAPGFNGYIIAKAGFRQGHGVAYVLGDFMNGASFDVAHGYLALVIPDPEFGGDRAPVAGESLGQ